MFFNVLETSIDILKLINERLQEIWVRKVTFVLCGLKAPDVLDDHVDVLHKQDVLELDVVLVFYEDVPAKLFVKVYELLYGVDVPLLFAITDSTVKGILQFDDTQHHGICLLYIVLEVVCPEAHQFCTKVSAILFLERVRQKELLLDYFGLRHTVNTSLWQCFLEFKISRILIGCIKLTCRFLCLFSAMAFRFLN